jgi:tRNA-Thr(GGU) m(6)t(6)A37 methyltransferase TsaA
MEIKYIGRIHSPLKSVDECPLQESENAPEAEVLIFPEYKEGIQSIKPGANLLLLTWLHEADRTIIKCIPRRDYDAAPLGVFSTRSPDRPNPVGIHSVKVISVSHDGLIRVSGLEVIDQTPLIDIKPDLK